MRSALRRAISSMSSGVRAVIEMAAKPCLQAFREERALPSGVRGPVLFSALARLAANCFSQIGRGMSETCPFDYCYSTRVVRFQEFGGVKWLGGKGEIFFGGA